MLCQAFVDNALFTGAFDGSIIQWSGTSISKVTKAHTDGCHSMISRPTQKGIISGGGDGQIILWAYAGGALS